MGADDHPWESIFARDGRVFSELLPVFYEAAQRFSDHQSRKILDLGCGNGRHLVALQKLGFDMAGFDISPTGLELSRDWLKEEGLGHKLVVGDCRFPLPYQSGSFDGLISTQVIHHALISQIRVTISEINRVLSKDGLALISVAGRIHDDTSYLEIEPGTYLPQDGPEAGLPHHIFSEEEIQLEFNAFQILEICRRDSGRVILIWLKKSISSRDQVQIA